MTMARSHVRSCCGTKAAEVHSPECGHYEKQKASADALRDRLLVPWALAKCERCGSTICAGPLEHSCHPYERPAIDLTRCAL